MFEFSTPVVVDKAYLANIIGDSDISVWIGTKTDPYNNHLTLDAGLLSSLGFTEVNVGGSSSRTAELNAGAVSGNVLVVAAKTNETTDGFKLSKLIITCP
jgi:hypothetical protein